MLAGRVVPGAEGERVLNSYSVKQHSQLKNLYPMRKLVFFCGHVFQLTIGIQLSINGAPLLAVFLLVIGRLNNSVFVYVDGVLFINPEFVEYQHIVSQSELEIIDT